MTETAEKLRSELQMLPALDRAELARFLIHSLEEASETPEEESELDTELTRRVEEIRNGTEPGEAAEDVFTGLRAKYSPHPR